MRSLLALLPLVLLACSGDDNQPSAAADAGSDAEETSADTFEAGPGTSCTSARDTAVAPVDKVSTSVVKIISDEAGVKTLFIDATAGGSSSAKSNPWVYLKLSTGTRVDLTDKQAFDSPDWDLAFKRPVIHTNSGDAGPGGGGARFLAGKAFDAVTVADVTSLKVETWFDAECQPFLDAIGSIKTTFDSWYTYEASTSKVMPKAGTFAVRGATGDLYKLEIQTYYGTDTGGTTGASGNYVIKYAYLGKLPK
ncbi:MAG: HmuY family protein [Deltaproteobacteria bacterium]|nr:HmuY family protein [Deltaproteobacteria bacterium]